MNGVISSMRVGECPNCHDLLGGFLHEYVEEDDDYCRIDRSCDKCEYTEEERGYRDDDDPNVWEWH